MKPPESSQIPDSRDVLAKYGGLSRITSMISQILKVTAAIDLGKLTQEEGYGILKQSGIEDKELTELIELVETFQRS